VLHDAARSSARRYTRVFALAESLHVNNTVTEMDLSYNFIDDAGVATLARLLKAGAYTRPLFGST
jgi:hypothetical protein